MVCAERVRRNAPQRWAFAALTATTLLVSDAPRWGLPGQAQAQQQEFFLNVAPVMLAEQQGLGLRSEYAADVV